MCETWDSTPFQCSRPTYNSIGPRRFGVELETSNCEDYEDIQDSTIWACKTDCSIDGMEFISPVLWGDQGLREVARFCKLASNWEFDSKCGYHVHLDMTHELWRNMRSIAYAYLRTYPTIWSKMVTSRRADNAMCGEAGYHNSELRQIHSYDDWCYFVGIRDRFEFVNWRAWFSHRTLEIRLHEGTLNNRTIINWIKLHSVFIDTVRTLEPDDIDLHFGSNSAWDNFSEIIGDELSTFYRGRATSFGHALTPVERIIF